jgi:hypothetical protein
MPSTYTLISSNVLASSAASVTFSAIPSTYTDLVLRANVRSDLGDYADYVTLAINALGANADSQRTLYNSDGTVASGSGMVTPITGNTATSNTFSNTEYYFSMYSNSSTKKPFSIFSNAENNSSTQYFAPMVAASLTSSTAAITALTFRPAFGSNLVSGSSFYLYGIKNS